MKHINDVTTELANVVRDIRAGNLDNAKALLIIRSCGTTISGINAQLSNAKLRKELPKIAMLEGTTELQPVKRKRKAKA